MAAEDLPVSSLELVMQVRFSFFLKELLLFVLAMATGIFVAHQYSFAPSDTVIVQPLEFSWPNLVLVVAFFLIFSFVLSRFKGVAAFFFKVFLFLVIFSGSQLFFAGFLTSPWDLIFAGTLAAVNFIFPGAFFHNLGMILGIGGVAALLGLSVTPLTALLLITALSIYDIIAVYKTRHMVHLAENMVRSRAIFGFLIPMRLRDFFARFGSRPVQEQFMILGSGDIGLPIVLASSLVTTSLNGAIAVAVGASLGLFVTHLLFVNQQSRQAMAALPPIATGSIIGFCIALML